MSSYQSAKQRGARDGAARLDAATLTSAAEVYDDRWYRPLTAGEELGEAQEAVAAMHDAALELLGDWDDVAARLPSGRDVQEAMESTRVRWQFLRPLLNDTAAERIIALVGRINDFTSVGHDLLRTVRPSVVYARHFEREAARLDSTQGGDATMVARAARAREDIELLQGRLEGDVESQRSQIEILSMYSQMALANRVMELTRILAFLTFLLVVGTLGAVAVSIFSSFFK